MNEWMDDYTSGVLMPLQSVACVRMFQSKHLFPLFVPVDCLRTLIPILTERTRGCV